MSENEADTSIKKRDCFVFNAETYTSDLGVQRREIGIVRMSEAWQALLYSQEGNFTVAMPSCSLMDITMPTLPSTPFPTTCRGITGTMSTCSSFWGKMLQHLKLLFFCGESTACSPIPLPSRTWTSEPILIVSLKPPRAQSAATACLPMACSLASFLPLLLPFSRILSAYFPNWGMNIKALERTYHTAQWRKL